MRTWISIKENKMKYVIKIKEVKRSKRTSALEIDNANQSIC
mgnify:CR=1 FL=1